MTKESWFDSGQGQAIFLFSRTSRLAVGLIQPLTQWVLEALSPRTGYEDDHSPPSSAKVKNKWSYASSPPYAVMGFIETTSPLLSCYEKYSYVECETYF
jgi:hypothetical protein